ncbi:hypothetical protein HBH69_056890 [Parastagonospora nodorum]|nr:hypothetical protein HBH69_056890 [Parastagonospora nodorum]KAH5329953.1 hypothetical protein HBI12_068620 [Parastagonospora nodorum]KAH5707388.1 hypothetical protein HBI20_205210 [Parastagonospora nodorum]KAH6244299.1 hypothetical protein HBI42_206310 [Parastagonospora nodorum]
MVQKSSEETCYDLLSLLGIVQELKVDLLPITWQPALSEIGQGGSARINQSQINLETSFAFKRFKWIHKNRDQALWKALISEVSILASRDIREHPHVVQLEGICWEPFEQEASVRPVLLFEKSAFGDVFKFANSESGHQASLRDILRICTDVAIAVQDLNRCGVIHGDIKPQNILVFKSRAGQLLAKITDFGYSTKAATDTLIKMPKSPKWHAPEHHFGWICRAAAVKMDIYSFGLFCFWFALGADHGPFSTHTIASTRKSGKTLLLALNAIEAEPSWSLDEKVKMKDLALATLHHEPSLRCVNFDQVADILKPIG